MAAKAARAVAAAVAATKVLGPTAVGVVAPPVPTVLVATSPVVAATRAAEALLSPLLRKVEPMAQAKATVVAA